MPQIYDVIANENAHCKRNELECNFKTIFLSTGLEINNTIVLNIQFSVKSTKI